MRSLQFGILLAMAFLAFSLPCVAATLEVQKDGSGDFVTIQAALDAAQEGDTVLIGPGRYDTFTGHTFQTGGTLAVVGVVTTPNITIEGTSRSGVVVGPTELQAQVGGISTLGLGTDTTATGMTIRNLTVENCQGLIGFVSSGAIEGVTGRSAGQTGIQVSSLNGLVIRVSFLLIHPPASRADPSPTREHSGPVSGLASRRTVADPGPTRTIRWNRTYSSVASIS